MYGRHISKNYSVCVCRFHEYNVNTFSLTLFYLQVLSKAFGKHLIMMVKKIYDA